MSVKPFAIWGMLKSTLYAGLLCNDLAVIFLLPHPVLIFLSHTDYSSTAYVLIFIAPSFPSSCYSIPWSFYYLSVNFWNIFPSLSHQTAKPPSLFTIRLCNIIYWLKKYQLPMIHHAHIFWKHDLHYKLFSGPIAGLVLDSNGEM